MKVFGCHANETEEMNRVIAITLIAGVIVGCHKTTQTCDQTMSAIAGQYKLIKVEHVAYDTGTAEDITSWFTICQLSAIYTLNPDSTVNYTEPGNCAGSGTGHWKTEFRGFHAEVNSADCLINRPAAIESWDCKTLVLISQYPSVNFNDRLTLTRL